MKKIAVLLLILIGSCKVVTSAYAPEITYWSYRIAETGVQITQQAALSYNATKAGKADSAFIYFTNGLLLNSLLLQYRDSLVYYVKK